MAVLAWLRRLIVSIGIGGTSYAIMLGIMVLSVVYDRQLEPIIAVAFDTGRSIVGAFDSLVSGSHWGQVAVNHLRERVNMTHVVLSIPAVVIAAIVVGIPFNWLLGGTRTAAQRIAIALVSVPATVGLAVVLFTFNALIPDAYAGLLRFADWIWQASLNWLSASGDAIPGAATRSDFLILCLSYLGRQARRSLNTKLLCDVRKSNRLQQATNPCTMEHFAQSASA